MTLPKKLGINAGKVIIIPKGEYYLIIPVPKEITPIETNQIIEELKQKAGEKAKSKSVTETIRRLAKRRRLTDCAGLWSDIPEEEIKAVWHSIDELRRRHSKSLD